MRTRIERDFLGEIEIPDNKLYGCCTQRTINTCSISQHNMPLQVFSAILEIKQACAVANNNLGKLSNDIAKTILKAIELLKSGRFDDNFISDVFQNGAGTSINMNVNEVISGLAQKKFNIMVHPNNDVNMSQSTNDVIPTGINISTALEIKTRLIPSLQGMLSVLEIYSDEWKDIIKIGRTHMQDAVPMSLGQEFSAFARQIEKCTERCLRCIEILKELPIGGTAIGSGLNAHKDFSSLVVSFINEQTEMDFVPAKNKFCEQASKDSIVEVSGILNSIACAVSKIARDLKFLSSGPRAGISELVLPATQAGSSIMPGKVNPAMCEMLIQVCYYVNGMMLTVLLSAQNGELQVNTAMPVMIYALIDSISILSNAINNFSRFCLEGLRPNIDILTENAKKSLMLITSIAPIIGYDVASEIVKEAVEKNETVMKILQTRNLLDQSTIASMCDPKNMIR